MTSLAASSQIDRGFGLSHTARSAAIVVLAALCGLVLAVFGVYGVLLTAAVVVAAAMLLKPEFGMYVLFLSLAFPVPFQAGPKYIYPHDAAALIVIVSAVLWAVGRGRFTLPPIHYMLPAACLLIVQIISLANSQELAEAGLEVIQQFYLLIVCGVAYYLVLRDERTLNRIAFAFMLLMLAQGIYTCAQFLTVRAGNSFLVQIVAFDRHSFRGSSRVFGTIGPTIGALFVASCFLWLRHNTSWVWKLPALLVQVLAILATGTRSAMLALAVTACFYGIFAGRKLMMAKLMIPVTAGFFIFVAITGFSDFRESLTHSSDVRYRVPIDTKALRAVPEHPVIGHGPKSAAKLSTSIFGATKISVENEFVARLYENGILGLVALTAFGSVPVLFSARLIRRKARTALLAATMAAVIVGVYSTGPASCIFEGSLGHWLIIFYAMMLAAVELSRRNSGTEPCTENC